MDLFTIIYLFSETLPSSTFQQLFDLFIFANGVGNHNMMTGLITLLLILFYASVAGFSEKIIILVLIHQSKIHILIFVFFTFFFFS